MQPTEDITPLRSLIRYDPNIEDRFLCPHCRMPVRCPPVAMMVRPPARALDPVDVAEELNPPPGETTRVVRKPDGD